MRVARALRLGLRREVLILLPVALFLLALLSIFTLRLYRSAIDELTDERRQEALVAAERLAASIAEGGLPSAEDFDRLAPQAAGLALLNRRGQPILRRGAVSAGDQLAPFRELDLTRSHALGPGEGLAGVIAAVAPAPSGLSAHYTCASTCAGVATSVTRAMRPRSWRSTS